MDQLKATLIVAAVLTFGVVVRLLFLGVQKQLLWLTVFLGCAAFQLVVPGLVFPMTSRIYRDVYFFSEPITWILAVAMIQEMYRQVFQRYPAISRLGRWSTYGCAISAVAVCTFMLSVTPAHQLTTSVIQTYTVFWEMCTLFTLGVFVLLMILIVGRYPLRLDPNLIRNIAILSIYLFGTALILGILQSDRGQAARIRAFAVIGLQAGCAMLWGVLMRKPAPVELVREPLADEQAARLLRQLGQLNDVLAGSVRQSPGSGL